jgi:hypothetical protein
MNELEMYGGAIRSYHSDIGDVISFVPRYQIGGGFRTRNNLFPRKRIGYGFGSTLFSFFKPLLKKGLHAVVNFASNVATDALEGENVKESMKKHALNTVSDILQRKDESETSSTIPPSVSTSEISRRRSAATVPRRKVIIKKTKLKTGSGFHKKTQKLNSKFPILELM